MISIPKSLRSPIAVLAAAAALSSDSKILEQAKGAGINHNSDTASADSVLAGAAFGGERDPNLFISVAGDSVTRQLTRYIATLKGRGYPPSSFTFSNSVCTENKNSFFLLEYEVRKPGVKVTDQNPGDSFAFEYEQYIAAPTKLVGRAATDFSFSPLSVDVTVKEEKRRTLFGIGTGEEHRVLQVKIYDRLTGDKKPVAEVSIDPSDKSVGQTFEKLVKDLIETRTQLWRQRLAAIPALHARQVNPIIELGKVDSLQVLPPNIKLVGFSVIGIGTEYDLPHRMIRPSIDADLRQTIKVRGEIDKLILNVQLPAQGVLVNDLGMITRISGKAVKQAWFDKYENLIFLGSFSNGAQSNDIALEVHVSPPSVFQLSQAEAQKVKVDLSRIGLGDIILPIQAHVVPAIDIVPGDKVQIYSSIARDVVTNQYSVLFPELRAGVADAVRLFALVPGQDVAQIVIQDSRFQNAIFDRSNRRGIIIYDALLELNPEDARPVSRHEAIHLVDGKYDNALSGGQLADYWSELRSQDGANMSEYLAILYGGGFLRAINEQNFCLTIGGHAQDSPAEFFATLCNTLVQDDWDSRIKQSSTDFKSKYYRALLALEHNLKTTPDFPRDAPIIELVEARKLSLRTMAPGVEGYSPFWPGSFIAK